MGRILVALAVAAALAAGMSACEKKAPPDNRSGLEKSADNAGKSLEGAARDVKKSIAGTPDK